MLGHSIAKSVCASLFVIGCLCVVAPVSGRPAHGMPAAVQPDDHMRFADRKGQAQQIIMTPLSPSAFTPYPPPIPPGTNVAAGAAYALPSVNAYPSGQNAPDNTAAGTAMNTPGVSSPPAGVAQAPAGGAQVYVPPGGTGAATSNPQTNPGQRTMADTQRLLREIQKQRERNAVLKQELGLATGKPVAPPAATGTGADQQSAAKPDADLATKVPKNAPGLHPKCDNWGAVCQPTAKPNPCGANTFVELNNLCIGQEWTCCVEKRRYEGTVEHFIRSKSCQYQGVSNLAKQIMDGTECFIRAKDNRGAVFETIRGMPNVQLNRDVEALTYLLKPVADALRGVAARGKGTPLKITAGLRTLPQQLAVYEWQPASSPKHPGLGCPDVKVASPPNSSPHEAGISVDVDQHEFWMPHFNASGVFKWFGAADPNHFDFTSPVRDIKPISIKAFQTLWNVNNPTDVIPVSGAYDEATDFRLRRSPSTGFARSLAHADCAAAK